jgi:aryl-alcohol dehydrogenase-like predicted oxidoreductase/NAD-dependent dihydropyrimidine dehydrogenase PreA subunit
MKTYKLGNSGIEVTELCLGVLPMGPLQKNVTVEEGSEIIAEALRLGVNFLDTAQMYKTYPYIRRALEKTGHKPVMASKSAATTYEDMEAAIEEALVEMGLEKIDIFHLHAAKANADVFEIREGALQCLKDFKDKGIIRAVGISTHNPEVVARAAEREDIDVVFALINRMGRGLYKGTLEEMEQAIEACRQSGKGVYLMKILGGGTLIDDYAASVNYGRELGGGAYPVAIGVVSQNELLYNVRYFNDDPDIDQIEIEAYRKQVWVFKGICQSCGKCIEVCHSEAISYDDDGKAWVDTEKCIQCGYCISECPHFAIRIL